MRIKQRNTFRVRIFTFFILLVSSHVGITHSAEQIITNDLYQNAPKQYTVNGLDPYIIFTATAEKENVAAKYLHLDLGVELNDVSLELFFKNENDIFNPHFKLGFTVKSFPVVLAIPRDVEIISTSRLRLDINQCFECQVNFASAALLSNSLDLTATSPYSVENGIGRVADTGSPISFDGWSLNDVKGDIRNFKISGDDPFIVSPRKIIRTDQFAGVYFKLKVPNSREIWNDFQLFYQTDRHAFEAQASTTFRLQNSVDGILEFMIPLQFLSKELPSDSILKRLRLDMPDIEGPWSLLATTLIHEQQMPEFQKKIPEQLMQIKHQRSTGLALAAKSFKNVLSDVVFAISYFLLIVFTCFIFLRAYRSST
jgi:hypothetical protein